MFKPHIKITPSIPLVILVASIVFSYFTHIAWWALAGIFFSLSALTDQIKAGLSWFFLILFFIMLILGIIAMKWTFF